MKKNLFLLFILLSKNSSAQFCWAEFYNFETNFGNECDTLWIDDNLTANLWQVGHPNKNTFTGAQSNPNVIVTDTIGVYPFNNTSVFYWRIKLSDPLFYTTLSGWYFSDCDSLNDYGQIFMLKDTGTAWVEITGWNQNSQPAILTGNSGGWKYFTYNLNQLFTIYNIVGTDSLTFKFSFHSDMVNDNRDGLMYDDLQFENYIGESVNQLPAGNSRLTIFPNPISGQLTISNMPSAIYEMEIADLSGRKIYTENIIHHSPFAIQTSISAGIYFLKVKMEDGSEVVRKFVKR